MLSASGTTSAQDDGLALEIDDSVPGQAGLFFQANGMLAGGAGVPFGDGLRCIGAGGVVRIQVRFAGASGSTSSTVSIVTQGAVVAGDTRYYQWWYRDPAGSCTGQTFNFSNGWQVDWQ